jgi:hypothetical protein
VLRELPPLGAGAGASRPVRHHGHARASAPPLARSLPARRWIRRYAGIDDRVIPRIVDVGRVLPSKGTRALEASDARVGCDQRLNPRSLTARSQGVRKSVRIGPAGRLDFEPSTNTHERCASGARSGCEPVRRGRRFGLSASSAPSGSAGSPRSRPACHSPRCATNSSACRQGGNRAPSASAQTPSAGRVGF